MNIEQAEDTHIRATARGKVSLVIPVYNEGEGLQRLREALLPLLDNAMTLLPDGRRVRLRLGGAARQRWFARQLYYAWL